MHQQYQLVKNYNDRLSGIYDEATSKTATTWTAPQAVQAYMLPHIREGNTVLDIGVGTGQSSIELYNAGADITGIDISGSMLELTKQKFPAWWLIEANVDEKFPSGLGTFDMVVTCGVVEFLQNLPTFFREVAHVLHPQGLFSFTFETFIPGHALQGQVVSTLAAGIIEPAPPELSFLVYRHTLTEVEALLQSCGFAIEKHSEFVSYERGPKKIPVIYEVVLARKET